MRPIRMSKLQRSAPSGRRGGESTTGQIDGAKQHVRQTPRHMLSGRRHLHSSSGPLRRGGKLASQCQRSNFAVRGQIPQKTVDPALDCVPALGHCQNVLPPSHQRQRQPAAEDRPFNRLGRHGLVGEHVLQQRDGIPQLVPE